MSLFFRIEGLNAEQGQETVDHFLPRKIDYEKIIVITHGNPKCSIDLVTVILPSPMVIYVEQGRLHQFLPDEATKGWFILYSPGLLPQNNFHFFFNFTGNFYYPLLRPHSVGNISLLCSLMSTVSKQQPTDFTLVKYLLQAIFAVAESAGSDNYEGPGLKKPGLPPFTSFLRVLEENYRIDKGVQFYARKLNTSVRNLNRICHLFFEKGLSAVIETRKLVEARKLLGNSNMSVSEIGFLLGYAEKSYFTRVFRKKTGFTPTAFRAAMKKHLL